MGEEFACVGLYDLMRVLTKFSRLVMTWKQKEETFSQKKIGIFIPIKRPILMSIIKVY
jgi:hypothetical protein